MPPTAALSAVFSVCLSILLVSRLPAYSLCQSYVWTSLALFAFFSGARLVYSVILYPTFFTSFKHIPVPPGRSLLNGHFYMLFVEPTGYASRRWTTEVPNDGLLRYYLLFNTERLFPTSAKALGEILVHKAYDFQKADHLKLALEKSVGRGILLAEGEEHKLQRKSLMPAFSYRHIKNLYPIFWLKAVEMANAIEQTVEKAPDDKGVVRISDWASRTTLDIIGLAGMGHDFGSIQDPNNMLNVQYRKMFSEPPMVLRIIQFITFLTEPRLFNLLPLQRNRDAEEGARYIRALSRQMIQDRKKKMEKSEELSMDILSVALKSGGFTEEGLVDQLMTFLAAGHETTSSAFQWTVYALCRHPEIQTRLREEIRSNISSFGTGSHSSISAAIIDGLPFLNAVCNEVLRFYPPVPLTVREAVRDTTVLGTFIPKGTLFNIVPAATNHNPELWGPDASVFNPDRWMGPGRANSGGADSNYAFLTFLHGPRSCIGQGFSKAELACLVAVMVGRFEMELENPYVEFKVKSGITSSPKDGVVVKLKPVESRPGQHC